MTRVLTVSILFSFLSVSALAAQQIQYNFDLREVSNDSIQDCLLFPEGPGPFIGDCGTASQSSELLDSGIFGSGHTEAFEAVDFDGNPTGTIDSGSSILAVDFTITEDTTFVLDWNVTGFEDNSYQFFFRRDTDPTFLFTENDLGFGADDGPISGDLLAGDYFFSVNGSNNDAATPGRTDFTVSFEIGVVPEPTGLMPLAVLGLAAVGRRKRSISVFAQP